MSDTDHIPNRRDEDGGGVQAPADPPFADRAMARSLRFDQAVALMRSRATRRAGLLLFWRAVR